MTIGWPRMITRTQPIRHMSPLFTVKPGFECIDAPQTTVTNFAINPKDIVMRLKNCHIVILHLDSNRASPADDTDPKIAVVTRDGDTFDDRDALLDAGVFINHLATLYAASINRRQLVLELPVELSDRRDVQSVLHQLLPSYIKRFSRLAQPSLIEQKYTKRSI